MSKTRGLVFEGERYVGSPAPLVGLPDKSRWGSNGTFTNHAAWTQRSTSIWTVALDGGDDYVQVPAASSKQLNFTSEDFTLMCWAYSPGMVAACYIMGQGATDVDGWGLFCFVNNLSLRLNQAAGHTDISAVNGFADDLWQLVAVTRTGNTGQFYCQGVAIATIGGGGLADAVSVAGGNKLLFGIADNELTNAWDGSLEKPRAFSYALSAAEHYSYFEAERRWFGI